MPPVYYHDGKFPSRIEIDWSELIPLLGPAAATVARYDGMLAAIPNPDVLLAPLSTQEAVLSSRIEGTQATMGEVLEYEAGKEPDSPVQREDIHEVLNYRSAMRHAEDMLKKVPLSQRVIRAAHGVLLSGVRGHGKSPGAYRKIPNWIGPPGCTIEDAKFVPVGADKLPNAMSVWERYIHEDTPDRLVQLAILHAEFEALHPFLDGNGRLGRMFIPLYLWQSGLIRTPMFYISAYFEARRDTYYERLLAVSRDNDWTRWCRFFLEAVQSQAEDNVKKAKGILDLYEDMKGRIMNIIRSQYMILALDWIFQYPVFNSSTLIARSGIPEATARRILKAFQQAGILEVIITGRGNRSTVLAFPEILDIAEGKTIL